MKVRRFIKRFVSFIKRDPKEYVALICAYTLDSDAILWLSGCRICSGGSSGRSGTVRTWSRFNSTSGGTLTEVNGINGGDLNDGLLSRLFRL